MGVNPLFIQLDVDFLLCNTGLLQLSCDWHWSSTASRAHTAAAYLLSSQQVFGAVVCFFFSFFVGLVFVLFFVLGETVHLHFFILEPELRWNSIFQHRELTLHKICMSFCAGCSPSFSIAPQSGLTLAVHVLNVCYVSCFTIVWFVCVCAPKYYV